VLFALATVIAPVVSVGALLAVTMVKPISQTNFRLRVEATCASADGRSFV
jgi:hypothetical protein